MRAGRDAVDQLLVDPQGAELLQQRVEHRHGGLAGLEHRRQVDGRLWIQSVCAADSHGVNGGDDRVGDGGGHCGTKNVACRV